MYGLKQEGKHQFLIDLSRNTARGLMSNAVQGYLCGQAAPFGFDRMLLDESGTPRQRVRTGEQTRGARSWKVTLVPSDDPEKVKIAKWMFSTYANQDIGIRQLADELNQRGVPSPRGCTWCVGTVAAMLKNEAYMGDFVWGKRREGKYHRVAKTEIKARTPGDQAVMDNPKEEWIVVKDAWEPLVDRNLWAFVQSKMTRRCEARHSHKGKNGERYVLTGLLYCQNCGAKMYGAKSTRRKGGKVYEYYRYVCSTYHSRGKSCCGHNKIDESLALSMIVDKLRETMLAGCSREALAAKIQARMESRQVADPSEINATRRKIADLDKEIEHGTKRLLRAPDDVADLLAGELAKIRREQERLTADLNDMEDVKGRDNDAAARAKQLAGQIWQLSEKLSSAPPAKVREVLSRFVARVSLTFDKIKKGTRVECPFLSGSIALRPDPLLSSLVSRGDWI
jgi:site-specific DNA recombinase